MDTEIPFEPQSGLPRDLIYFALRPDTVAARATWEVITWATDCFGLAGHPYEADRLHVSLCEVVSPHGFRKGDVATAFDAAARVRAQPFSVVFDRICTFGGGDKRPIVLRGDDGKAAIATFRNTLRRELAKVTLWPGPARFEPHVTLLWDKRRVPDIRLDEPICWTVRDFVLVRSLIGRSRHIDLGRWPLGA